MSGLIELRDGGRKRETRQGQGDGHSLGTEQLPISQLPLLNTGITEKAENEKVHHCGSLFPPAFPHLLSLMFSLFFVGIT